MRANPGTYVVLMHSRADARVQIGRWGTLQLHPGFYAYVGSAFGPGGVLSRVARHCRGGRTKRWHIDYLRAVVSPESVWYSHSPTRLEHRWAAVLAEMDGMEPVEDFGSSDCGCPTHLYFSPARPSLEAFTRLARGPVRSASCEMVATLCASAAKSSG